MARRLRTHVPDGWYHVMSRGNGGEALYRTDEDRRRFLGVVAELRRRCGTEVHAFVLMDNHYHLLVRCRRTDLSDREEGALDRVARYLHLSPVRIDGMGLGKEAQRRARVKGCDGPGAELVARRLRVLTEYRWSSWRVYAGREAAPGWLSRNRIQSGCAWRKCIGRCLD